MYYMETSSKENADQNVQKAIDYITNLAMKSVEKKSLSEKNDAIEEARKNTKKIHYSVSKKASKGCCS